MYNLDTLQAVLDYAGVEQLTKLVIVNTINNTTKVKNKDITVPGHFTDKVIRRITKYFFCDTDHAAEWLERVVRVSDYENIMILHGIGGCTPLSIKQAWTGEQL